MKKCTKCGEVKELERFSRNKTMNDGLQAWCRGCKKAWDKEHYKINREAILVRVKEYRIREIEAIHVKEKEHRERDRAAIRVRGKYYYERNKEVRLAQYKEHRESIAPDTYLNKLPPSYEARAPLAVIEVKCKTCGKYFIPSVSAVKRCIMSYEGKTGGENNLYCSDGCKEACPVFRFQTGKQTDPRSDLFKDKGERDEVRQCQTDHLKQLQCDQYGYNFCEKCGDLIDVELHHSLPVNEFGRQAINSSGHLLLCAGCHVELHSECAREVEHA